MLVARLDRAGRAQYKACRDFVLFFTKSPLFAMIEQLRSVTSRVRSAIATGRISREIGIFAPDLD